jgi:uncharacterized protein YjdB
MMIAPLHTTRRRTLAAWLLGSGLAAILGLTACLDDSPVAAGEPTVRATFSANVVGAAAGGTVRIRVGYRTRSQQVVFLPSSPEQVSVAAGTTIVLPVTVHIARCLADESRVSAGEPGCKLLIELSLSDQTGLVDSDTTDAVSPTVPGGSINFGTVTVGVVVSTLVVTPASLRLLVGQQQQLTATPRDPKGAVITSVPVTWTTSDATVAQLSATTGTNVTVRGLKLGEATITATAKGKASAPVTLGVVPPTLAIRQRPAAGCVIAGQTVALEVDSPPGPVSWSSSNPDVASVDASTGIVTGIRPGGSATITATSGGITGTTTICVATFQVTPATLSVIAARSVPLDVSASGGTLSFSSSAPAVATVDANGVIRGVNVGKATITATLTAASGSQSIPVAVTVTPAAIVITASLNRAPLGRSVQYSAVVQDADGATLPGVTPDWSVADATIAALSAASGASVNVKALKLGTTTVSAAVAGVVGTAPFTATPVTPAVGLEVVSGNGAFCPTYSLSCVLVARALDVDGFPVTGAVVTWSTTSQGCSPSKTDTTDELGQTTATNLCSSTAPGLYLQTVALVSGGAPLTFHYTLAGLVLTPQSVDTPNVAKFSVTAASVAAGLSATLTYRSGPTINYVTKLELSSTTTPASLVVGYDPSNLPPGQYVFDVTVSTTTPGLGPAIQTLSFSVGGSFFISPNAKPARSSRSAPPPTPGRDP